MDSGHQVLDEEEEIFADSKPSQGTLFKLTQLSPQYILENYGWFILFGLIIVYYIYKRLIQRALDKIVKQRQELERTKKYDSESHSVSEQRLQEARERAQRELNIKALELRERLEAKKRQQLEEAMKKAGIDDENIVKDSMTCTDPYSYVSNLIKSVPVVVFSKTYCPYCRKAKQALSPYRMPANVYKIIELDQRNDCDQIQDVLLKITGARSVPRVFIAGKCIGGGDDTAAAQKDGRLEKMLKEAGVI